MLRTAVAALLTAGVAPADDLKALQGEWKLFDAEVGIVKAGPDSPFVMGMRLTFKGSEMAVTGGLGEDRKEAFTLDPSKSPKHLDATAADGPDKGQVTACIYKLDGDRLTLCLPYRTKDTTKRPAEFKPARDVLLLVMDRVK